MAYTKHGHRIPGSAFELYLPEKARCGGPRMCSQCKADVAAFKAREGSDTPAGEEEARVYLIGGEWIPKKCLEALEELDDHWCGATLPAARASIAAAVLRAAGYYDGK